MIKYKKRKHGINFWTVWFANEPIKESGIIQYRQASFQMQGSEEFLSMITDLTESEDEIVGRFTKNCRYEVNRASREGVVTDLLMQNQIHTECIEEFLIFFHKFWQSKGIVNYPIDDVRVELETYATENILVITKALHESECLVYHTYVVADDCVRLLHSASMYREQEDVNSKIIGMANRYLHKEDLLAFKGLGMTKYDWGGAGMSDDVASITKFKESFGGTKVVQYNTRVHKGLLAKAFQKFVERG